MTEAPPLAPPEPQPSPRGGAAPALVAEGLRRTYVTGGARVEVLKGIDLSVAAGESLFLRGTSGAGKTTLLYTLAGLEAPDAGTVSIGGEDLYRLPKRRQAEFRNRRIGYIFQHYFLLPDLTAVENVLLPASMDGRAAQCGERAAELLRSVGLGERLAHRPTELSGGEQQRVAIARSLINDPDLIFADEPTGNLDSATGGEVMETLLATVSGQGKTLVVVTHDAGLAALGDLGLEIVDGRVGS